MSLILDISYTIPLYSITHSIPVKVFIQYVFKPKDCVYRPKTSAGGPLTHGPHRGPAKLMASLGRLLLHSTAYKPTTM